VGKVANFDLQIKASTFLAATLADLRSRQICPPPVQTIGGVEFLVQQIEFGTNSIRHEKLARFPVFYESHGETFGIEADGFQTQIAQTVVLHVTRADDVLAHPNGPPASEERLTVVAVLDLSYYPFDTQCFMTTSLDDVEFGQLPPLPPGVDPEQFKSLVKDLVGRAAGSPARPLNFANMLPFGGDPKVLNAGVTVSQNRNLLVFRAEVGLGSSYSDVPWGNFYKGSVIDHLAAPADWGLFIEKGMLEQTFATMAWSALAKQTPPEFDLISVGAEYSPAGDEADIGLTVHATVDLPGPAGTAYVEPTARIELSVSPAERRLTADVFLPDIKAIANHLLIATRLFLRALLGPLNVFAQALLDSAIAKLQTPTDIGIPGCAEVSPRHQRCSVRLPLPAFGDTPPRLTRLLALPDGIALIGLLPVPAFAPGALQSSIRELRWEPPKVSCGSADGAFGALFTSQVKERAPLRGDVSLDNTGTTPAYLCGAEVINDPLQVFPTSGLRWDGTTLPVTITLEVPNPGDNYAAAPYPVDLLVRTTLGTRLIRFTPAPPLTQADMTRLIAATIGQIANCKLITGPHWDLRWLIDPPFDRTVLHRWRLSFEGLQPRESLRLLDSSGRQLVQVNARPEGSAIMHALVAPVGAKELRLLREVSGATSNLIVEIRQQLVEPAAAISLDAPCRRVFPSSRWSPRGLVAILEDGIAAFDLSNPATPRRIGRWQIDGLQGACNWSDGLLAFSEDGFVTIDGQLRMTPVGPSLEPSPILGATPGDRAVHVLTGNALEVRSHRLVVRSQDPSDDARCMLRLGSRLLTGGPRGVTVRRLTATGHGAGVRSLPTLSVTDLEPAPDDQAVLVTLEDGSARLLLIDADDRMREIGQYAEVPWFAGGSRLGDALVVVGDGARSLQVNVLGQARAVGADAMDAVAPGLKFTDWTTIDTGRAEGRLHGSPVTLVGPLGTRSVTDGSSRLYDSDDFSPRLPNSDTVNILGQDGHSFRLTFGSSIQDVLLHFASLESEISFPAETAVAKVSGGPGLTVSGSKVRGIHTGNTLSYGTVRLFGVFRTLQFTTTLVVSGDDPNRIFLQIGGLMPTPAPAE
jgi:hypothetical protein